MKEFYAANVSIHQLSGVQTLQVVTRAKSAEEAERNIRWRLVNKRNPVRQFKDGVLFINKIWIFNA